MRSLYTCTSTRRKRFSISESTKVSIKIRKSVRVYYFYDVTVSDAVNLADSAVGPVHISLCGRWVGLSLYSEFLVSLAYIFLPIILTIILEQYRVTYNGAPKIVDSSIDTPTCT